jgi:hypothetical protein
MSWPAARVLWGAAALAAGVLLATCNAVQPGSAPDTAAERRAEEVRDLLPGTWLREYTSQDVRVRRVLRLQRDGAFHEAVRGVDPAGHVIDHLHEGTWLYDGTNLKRKYTLVDGNPPSRLNLPLATFEIAFETRNEFVGVDHIHRNRVVYQRVPGDTRP